MLLGKSNGMHFISHVIIVFMAAYLVNSKMVFRHNQGDMFELAAGRTCAESSAADYTGINSSTQRKFCKCFATKRTVFFDYHNKADCSTPSAHGFEG